MAFLSRSGSSEGPISLPLFKLSFCTTATHGSKFLWTHLTGKNEMFAVFDQVRKIGLGGSITERRLLKLTCGGELLEQIELDDLLFQVRLDESRMQSQQVQDSDLYVIVIVKRPLIALRYHLPDGQVRRLQLNFLPEFGYDTTLKIFASLGLPIRDKNLPSDPPVPSFTQPASQGFYQNTSPSRSQESAAYYQSRAPSAPLPVTLLPSPAINSMAQLSNFRPTSSAPETYAKHQDIVPTTFSQMMPPIRIPPFPSKDSNFVDNGPPSSAPETCSDLHDTAPPSLSQMLPPKRILPFSHKKLKPTTPEPKEIPPSPSEIVVAKFPSPAAANKKTVTQAKNGNAKAPTAKPRARRVKKPAENTSKNDRVAEAICRPSTPTTDIARPNAVSPINSLTPKAPHPLPLASTNANKSAPNPHSPPPLPPPSNPQGAQPPPPSPPWNKFNEIEPAEFMSRLDTWVREYRDLPAPKPRAAAGMDDLAAYAAQSKEARMKVLDDMICECLQDENFSTLVQDLDDSWRRIGLGF